jgi:hypothetical protein
MDNRPLLVLRLFFLDYVHQLQQSPENLFSFSTHLKRNLDQLRNRVGWNSHDLYWQSCEFCVQSHRQPDAYPNRQNSECANLAPLPEGGYRGILLLLSAVDGIGSSASSCSNSSAVSAAGNLIAARITAEVFWMTSKQSVSRTESLWYRWMDCYPLNGVRVFNCCRGFLASAAQWGIE